VTVERVPIVSGQNPVADGEADDYFCPVCGIGLSKSDFDPPEKDYYCPFCITRQAPSVL
jgi:rubredoxin